ncbi:MAG TPA: Z1 domain-containing protein, partial [Fimbriimonadaceae bacterium]|nr:Z1 domain-containing protein [Fimbriimonadaceae bacterium]
LQVTATPYALYLQPSNVDLPDVGVVKPTRPAFTELVPVHSRYVGGEFYFEDAKKEGSVASFLYEPVTSAELDVLHHQDKRRFKPEEALTSNGVAMLRHAIANFVVGALIRRLQSRAAGERPKKYSFIIHTESRRGAHAWQEEVVEALIEGLRRGALADSNAFKEIIQKAYNDISASVVAAGLTVPPFDNVLAEVEEYLPAIQVEKVNSEKDIMQLLDRQGQLELRNRLNIFIGGQILDRGLTIGNLIGFYYGRRSQKSQQDTVLQHHRMYGARPMEDLAVTRFYTSADIYDVLVRVHEFDAGLRKAIEAGGTNNGVVFVQKDAKDRIVPCSPNKILLSNVTTLRPKKRLLPVGFQTGYKTHIHRTVAEIDELVAERTDSFKPDDPKLITLADAVEIVRLVASTFATTEDSRPWDVESFVAAMQYASEQSKDAASRGGVWLLAKRDRENRRERAGRFFDAPDTAHVEGVIASRIARDLPMLMLFRQKGDKELGWRDCPFWWPVLYMPQRMDTVVFAKEVDDYDEDDHTL